MNLVLIISLSAIAFIILLITILGLIGYKFIYKRPTKPVEVDKIPDEKFNFPLSVKEKYKEYINIPFEAIRIRNKRGITLYGELRRSPLQKEKDTPTVILFSHGHLSSGKNDMPLFSNFQLKKYDVLAIDHEGNGLSEGKHSGFGIYEYENIMLWVTKINEIYNHKVNIFLHGVSMGSNSVLLTANKKMENVKGIIGDCGYTSTYKIIRKVTKSHIATFSVCLIISIILRRNVFKYSTLKTLKNSLYPILLIHGKSDDFVPFHMSELNDKVCSSKHKFIPFLGATHAMSYLSNPELYEKEFDAFINENS